MENQAKALRIVFMGTPDFAVESLKALVEECYNVVAVITMPDKPAGRGHKMQASPVKEYAVAQGLPVLQPKNLKDEAFLCELRSYNADLQIVVAFRMLPESVWSMPPKGTFNLHASLLPQYRGAAPINWAIINGDKQTGCTTFLLKHEIDTGDILLQRKISIADDETAGMVHDRLMTMGAKMVCETVDMIANGDVKPIPQSVLSITQMRPAPKIFKETCEIDFNKTAIEVHNFVRGLSPSPAAWCNLQLGDKVETVKLYSVTPTDIHRNENIATGTISVDTNDKAILIACKDYYIKVLEMQFPGRKRMAARDILNGLHL